MGASTAAAGILIKDSDVVKALLIVLFIVCLAFLIGIALTSKDLVLLLIFSLLLCLDLVMLAIEMKD